ncbi:MULTISPECIES: serine O-acetyltransferase [Helicobacter]|uniref:serine O-acetyltransferase n=2 Tax=Helicobacteraceae TaxID=72293 RepID=UPI000DCDF28A|nr:MULTISPECIES: serine O-acetyltransferase [Helicobacter]MCI2235632.1 serine O-acetyltransferase [Helicobacter sp. CaF467b]MCL9821422.1 serine O-acetyltransferase [Helicobacter colisuis]MCL9823070.1 serine O-acetyltransferase [Helicobacter colisuis]MDY4426531.1 serine O-acetyltransferase [Helicobacter sp.]RAX52815.1 serine O-acetyltransferase [Helicobacter sp. 11-8110]
MKYSTSLFGTIKEDFRVILEKDPAINSKIELFFNYPGLIALVHYRLAHKLHLKGFKILARILMGFTQWITNIDIHPACKIGHRVFIDHGIGVVIGETAEVGNEVTIYQGVSLGGVSLEKTKRHPTIEDNVVIGAGAKVLGNITIGANSKIGANSVVITSVPPNSTAVGIPAKVVVKGKSNDLNKIPDIQFQLFNYLQKRLELLESQIPHSEELQASIEKLNLIYYEFLKSRRE